MPRKPLILTILDGWGHSPLTLGNAIAAARKPTYDMLLRDFPHSLVHTSGPAVGLPEGQMGNSEVGHLNIGAGRVVHMDVTRIDALIAEQRRLIELLKEKRQAVISHAVTTGLNPNAPMKPSGVEWLGDVPAHRKIETARRLFVERDVRSVNGDEDLLTVSHITGVTLRSEKNVNMIEAESNEGYKICFPGDLVINTLFVAGYIHDVFLLT